MRQPARNCAGSRGPSAGPSRRRSPPTGRPPRPRAGGGGTGKGKGGRAPPGEASGNVQLWDVAASKEKRKLHPTDPPGVVAVASSPDGKYPAVAGGALIAVHEVDTGKQ